MISTSIYIQPQGITHEVKNYETKLIILFNPRKNSSTKHFKIIQKPSSLIPTRIVKYKHVYLLRRSQGGQLT